MRKLDLKPNALYVLIDVVLFFASVYIPYILRYNKLDLPAVLHLPFIWGSLSLPALQTYSLIFICWGMITVLVLNNYHLYSTARDLTIPHEIYLVFKAVVLSFLPVVLGIFLLQLAVFSRMLFMVSVALIFILFVIWRIIKRLVIRKLVGAGFNNLNVLIIGAGRVGKMVQSEISVNPLLGLKVCGFLDDDAHKTHDDKDGCEILGTSEDFEKIVRKKYIDEIFITIPPEHAVVKDILERAVRLGVNIKIVPQSYELILGDLKLHYLGIIPLLSYYSRGIEGAARFYKRLLDLVISIVALLFLAPFFMIIAILIKLDTKGPVFYIQKRVGLKERVFNLIKFRSMVCDADKLKADLMHRNEVKDGVIFKIKKDPRITRVGSFLRKYSIDEFPQFINVLKGDMSLVGPRPPTAGEVAQYKIKHLERLSVKPGITGLAQIKGRSDLTFYKWMRWDCWYINNWSLALDLKIMLETVPIVIRGKGAY